MPAREERLVSRGSVGGIETLVYNTGLILAVTGDRQVARSTINQIFGVLSRSGIQSLALPDLDMIQVVQFEAMSGKIGGSNATMTPRNKLLGVPTRERLSELSYCLPEETAGDLLELADRCTVDHDTSVASARLLSAVTLYWRQFHTEAFVTSWSLIETSIARDFKTFWVDQGRSKTSIGDMDWTASTQIDLLIAVGILDRRLGQRIHALRKRRNHIVHELADATEEEALRCIEVAAVRTPLPEFPVALSPQRVLL